MAGYADVVADFALVLLHGLLKLLVLLLSPDALAGSLWVD